jgi:hypothetical protein
LRYRIYLYHPTLSDPTFSNMDVRFINYCRLYLQVSELSDIATAEGDRVAVGIYAGVSPNSQGTSCLEYPYQERPGPRAWRAWRKFIRSVSNDVGVLRRHLGRWKFSQATLHRRWPFVFSPSLKLLLQWRLDSYVILRQHRDHIYSFGFRHKCHDLPGDFVPVDCKKVQDGWRVSRYHPITTITSIQTQHSLFKDYLDDLPDYERCQLLHFDLMGNSVDEIVSKLQTAELYHLVNVNSMYHIYKTRRARTNRMSKNARNAMATKTKNKIKM